MTPPDLRAVRAQLPALAATTYLNSGAIGPLCLPAARALAEWAEAAPRRARGSLEGFGRISAQAAAVRAAAARLVGAGPETVALTANTTHGLNLAAWGIDWRPGDEIVTTALEHPGLPVPLAVVARRTGARLRVIGAERARGDLERAVAEVAGPRTRLVALSHVSWSTGAVLDVPGRPARRAPWAPWWPSTAPRPSAPSRSTRPRSGPMRTPSRRTSGCWAPRASARSGCAPRPWRAST